MPGADVAGAERHDPSAQLARRFVLLGDSESAYAQGVRIGLGLAATTEVGEGLRALDAVCRAGLVRMDDPEERDTFERARTRERKQPGTLARQHAEDEAMAAEEISRWTAEGRLCPAELGGTAFARVWTTTARFLAWYEREGRSLPAHTIRPAELLTHAVLAAVEGARPS